MTTKKTSAVRGAKLGPKSASAEVPVEPMVGNAGAQPKARIRVLIAEDNPADTEMIVRELRRAGYEPEWQGVDSEAAYLEALHAELDLIFSDYHMPQFGGTRALELLRERGLEIPFIIISGTIGEEIAVAVMKQGAADYLLKDRLTRLGQVVEHALEQGRMRRERQQAVEALRESVRFAQSTIDALSVNLCVLDETGTILATNEAWRRFAEANPPVGLRADTGDNYLTVCDTVSGPEADDATAFTAGIRAVLRGERAEFVQEYPCHSPSEQRWFVGRVTRFSGAGLVRVVVAHEDITERKRSEARFHRLVDSNAQGVMFWNMQGAITGANDAFLRIVGYDRAELEAGDITWEAVTPPEYLARDQRAFQEVLASGVCAPYEKEYVRPDGSRVPVLLSVAIFEGNLEEGFCFVLDLTERKELERQFLRTQRMESIGTLAGGIAHDLNNALGPIIMSLDLLKMRFTDAASQELLATISSSARHGANMVQQVLSFARGVEGRRMEVQVRHLIDEIEKIANDTFLKHIQVRTIVPNDLWTVLGDPTQLHQVLLNLCVNARDAMPHGGTLTLTAENLTFDAHYAGLHLEARPGPYVSLQVKDSGLGIPAALLEKIFDPFFTTKEVGKGTGLGLSTMLGIVKSHGGFVRVESRLGQGTKFQVYLPAQPETPAQVVAAQSAAMPRGNGELILVVDDEAAVRQITQQTLEAFGYRVVLAMDGADAVAIYAQRSAEIAAVLTDMTMPVMDGLATIRVLRKLNPAVQIIGASGLSASEDVAAATHLGVKYFLPKPYPAETLLKVLKQILSEG